MSQASRRLLAVTLLAGLAGIAWWMPWSLMASGISQGLNSDDDAPAWLPADGHRYSKTAFPELYAVVGDRFGGDSQNFALPDMSESHDYLANDRFGARPVFRCIAARKLEDNSPAGTLGWCDRDGH
jgi:hypothetical protein